MFRPHRLTLLIGLCLVVGCLALAGLLRPVGDGFRFIFLPVVRAVSQTSARFSLSHLFGSGDEMTRIRDLEDRLARLSIDKTKLQALEDENKALRTEAKFLVSSGYESLGARVIGREIQNGRSLLLIDRGKMDHVEVGQAVVSNGGIYIGKISLLKDQVSTVEIVTDPNARVSASLLGKRRLAGVVEGRGNGAAALTFIPTSAGVLRDQIVVTAGIEDKIPPNLPLGIVNAVIGSPTDPFLTAALEPLVRVQEIDLVSILQPSVLKR